MFRCIILALFAVFAITFLPSAAHAQPPLGTAQWKTEGTPMPQTNTRFLLFNELQSQPLGYNNRTFGVDLEWTTKGGDWEFRPAPPAPGVNDRRRRALTNTETVAMFNWRTRRYLVHQSRSLGRAELEWSKTPGFQWKVDRQFDGKLALFNEKVQSHLVYERKTLGINLGWAKLPPETKILSLPVQQPFGGFHSLVGTLDIGAAGKVTAIRNDRSGNLVRFVRPGKTTQDCAVPNFTIMVPAGQSLKRGDIKTLFGSETPRLPLRVVACVAQGERVSFSVPLSIDVQRG